MEKITKTIVKTTYTDLLRAFENAAKNQASKEFTIALQDLSFAVALSVLKKCYDVSCNPTIAKLRVAVIKDMQALKGVEYVNQFAIGVKYDANGEMIEDSDTNSILLENASRTYDGLDVVQAASVALLEAVSRQEKNSGLDVENWLELPYQVRRLKAKVWIKENTNKNGFETVETCAIKEIYKTVRREISRQGGITVDGIKYTYIEDIVHDKETGIDEVIYRRSKKYADIGGYTTDSYKQFQPENFDGGYNSNSNTYTASEVDFKVYDTIDGILDSLSLTARQREVIDKRLQGYGNKAIATTLGVSRGAIKCTLAQIRTKWTKAGYALPKQDKNAMSKATE